MYWDWKWGGIALGLTFLLAVTLIKPIGVSTQFVILNGIIADSISPDLVTESEINKSGFQSTNAYLNKSEGKYAKSVAKPLNYSLVFVGAMFIGGLLGHLRSPLSIKKANRQIPEPHRRCFGESYALRLAIAFLGGFIVLWGARLAGGCTSGHMVSGMMQTAVSGYLFAASAFAAAVPTAIAIYR